MIDPYDLPEQLILWDGPDGTRHSEHRSIGDIYGNSFPVGMGCEAFIRAPRVGDEYFALCCGLCSKKVYVLTKNRRPLVLALFSSGVTAEHRLSIHVQAHRVSRARFEDRRNDAYRRQRRIEKEIA